MKFIRAWWPQILGVVVVLGFLGWLALAGGSRGVAHVSASGTPSPTLSATQAIEQTVKDFVVAYDESATTEDPSAARALCVNESPAQSNAAVESDLTKQTGEVPIVDSRRFDETSWSVSQGPGAAVVVDVTFSEEFHIVSLANGQQIQARQLKTFHWHSEMALVGNLWKIESFSFQ